MAKLISYSHVMSSTRSQLWKVKNKTKDQEIRDVIKPNECNDTNLEILKKALENEDVLIDRSHFVRFMWAPTLCYQLHFPYSSHGFRKIWFMKRLFEYAVCQTLLGFIFAQYVIPITEKASIIWQQQGISLALLERLFKMSMPCVVIWILLFYGFFHCF